MYSLWQNEVQLGRLLYVHEQSSDDGAPLGLMGVLFPVASVAALRAVRQTRYASLPGSPVVHEFPEDLAPSSPDSDFHFVPRAPFTRLGPDGSGVPLEAIFSIRTDAGADVPTYLIEIERRDVLPDAEPAALREAGLPEGLRSVFIIRMIHEAAYPPRHVIEAVEQMLADASSRGLFPQNQPPPSSSTP